MRFVVDITQKVLCTKEIVLDADDAHSARVGAEITADRTIGQRVYFDRMDWDVMKHDGDREGLNAERLLDRRTRERGEGARGLLQCDACDAAPSTTVRYGDARVCSKCLASLPPLSG